jgi:hypothetical protein
LAIYRPRRSPLPLLAGAAIGGLLIGLAIGWTAWANQAPDLDEAAAAISTGLRDAAGLVEVSAIEYREAAADGQVVEETEFRGARDAVTRARERYDAVAGALRAVAPDRATSIEQGFSTLDQLMSSLAAPGQVDAAAAELEERLSPPS